MESLLENMSRVGRQAWVSGVILVVLASVIVAQRWYTRTEPIECDLASHAVIAHEMLAGRSLYSDIWDFKPPAIWLAYAAAESLVGYGPDQILALGLCAALLTLMAAYVAGRACGGHAAAIVAATAWAIICSDLWLWANQPNIEVFVNLAMAWALALLLGFDGGGFEWKRTVAIGVLFALASLFKQVSIVMVLALTIAHVIIPPGREGRRRAFVQVGLWFGIGIAAWALVSLYFAVTDRWAVFWSTMVEYPGYYSASRGGSMLANLHAGFEPSNLMGSWLSGTWPLVLLSVVIVLVGWASGSRRPWVLVLAALVGAHVAICLPGRFYNHYYQLLMPGLVVAAGLAVGCDYGRWRARLRLLAPAAVALVLTATAVLSWSAFGLSPEQWSSTKYNGPQYVISRDLAVELQQILGKDDSIYVWGLNPELYFWTKRSPPAGVLLAVDALSGPLAPELSRRIVEDLDRDPPEVLVVNMLHVARPGDNPVVSWIIPRYEIVTEHGAWHGLYAVGLRRHSSLLESWQTSHGGDS